VPWAPVGADLEAEAPGLPAGVVYELLSVVPGDVGVVFGAEAGRVGVPLDCPDAYGEDGWADFCSEAGTVAEPELCSGAYGDDALPDAC